MKFKGLLPIAILSVGVLAACGGPSVPVESEDGIHTVNVKNASDIEKAWAAGTKSTRTLEVEIKEDGEEKNAMAEILAENLIVTSTNTSVVAVNGLTLTVGDTVGTAYVSVKYYSTVKVLTITSVEVPPEPEHMQCTIAQAVEHLTQDTRETVIYEMTGYVVAWQSGKADAGKYGNYYLSDTFDLQADLTKCAYVYGSSPTNPDAEWNGEKYTQTTGDGFNTHELTKDVKLGSKISITAIGTYYNTTPEFMGKVTAVDHSSEPSDVPEPQKENKSLADIIALTEGAATKLYNTSFTIKDFCNNKGEHVDNPSDYGNLIATDGTNDILCYGTTATETAWAWNKADKYGFTNPKDFNTNDTTKTLKPGDTVQAIVGRCDYQDTKQISAVVTGVTKGEAHPCTSLTANEPAVTLGLNESKTLTFTVEPANCTDDIVITSNDTAVATVAGKVVTAVAAGNTTLTATCGEKTATINVTVNGAAAHGTVESDPLTVAEAIEMALALGPNTADTKDTNEYFINAQVSEITYTWSASNKNITINSWIGGRYIQFYKATVAEGGVDGTTIKVGDSIVVKGKLENYKGLAEVQEGGIVMSRAEGTLVAATAVTVAPTTIELDKREDNKKTATVTATVTPETATTPVAWSSASGAVATVKADKVSGAQATVTAAAMGNTTVSATCGSVKAEVAVTVLDVVSNATTYGIIDFTQSISGANGVTYGNISKNNNGYYQDGGKADTDINYAQFLSTTALWTSAPTSVKFVARIGGGSAKDLLAHAIEVVLLDASGNEIATTKTTVATAIAAAAGDDIEVTLPNVESAYGYKLTHMKEAGWNARYFSAKLLVE